MHIPDGFIDIKTAVSTASFSALGLTYSLRSLRRHLPEQQVPLIGLTAAFVFAAQMLNFPVAAGTSGHLIGAMLVAVLLGPNVAVLVMSSVLIVQCFMFADGGVSALGANIFNMALVAPISGYLVYSIIWFLVGKGERRKLFAIAIGAWCSTIGAAIACAAELALSGTVAWSLALPAMLGVHAFIGIGEALITVLVIVALRTLEPGFENFERIKSYYRDSVAYGLLVSLGMVMFLSPFASSSPDGLEKVAAQLSFEGKAENPVFVAPLFDYSFPGVGSLAFSTILAGVIGTVVIFLVARSLACIAILKTRIKT